jgi:hypothetical protein
MPEWSQDGKHLAFGGRAQAVRRERPWRAGHAVVVDRGRGCSFPRRVTGDAASNVPVTTAATSGHTPVDPILRNPGGIGLQWAADNSLVYMSYVDGFPHLYSIQHPGRSDKSGQPMLLTPGPFMVEQVALTPDRRFAIFNANTGAEPNDLDRRHLFKVPVNAPTPVPLTTGAGIEWSPMLTADGQTVAFLSSDAQRPPAPAIVPLSGGAPRRIAADLLPAEFRPAARHAQARLVPGERRRRGARTVVRTR